MSEWYSDVMDEDISLTSGSGGAVFKYNLNAMDEEQRARANYIVIAAE